MSKKEVTTKQETEVATTEMDGWGGGNDFSAQDLIIPKILPMQGMSKMVMDRKAQLGEFRESMNGELVGSIDEPVNFVPFHVEKVWVESIKQGNEKPKFAGIIPITKDNEDLPKEEHNGNMTTFRDFTYYVYVLLEKDLAEGVPSPYLLSLKRTSRRCGQKIMTQMFMRNRIANLNPAGKVMGLTGKIVEGEKGTYIVMDVNPMVKDTPKDWQVEAFSMLKMVNSGKAKVDQSDEGSSNGKQYASDNAEF